MSPLLIYGLKVCCISGLLYGIYYILLRNRNHHVWNRLFLVAAPVLSLSIPLITIPLLPPVQSSIPQLGLLLSNTTEISVQIGIPLSLLLYGMVSLVILFMLIRQIIKIYQLREQYSYWRIKKILFIDSDAPGTPFSWFRWVFWNKNIDLHSPEGKKILRHEMVHVHERHSWDKLMIRLILIFFWFNPFFWLIGRELAMVHEFLADRHIAGEGEEGAFARMLLTAAMPGMQFSFRNPFYFSPIKRRIMMIKNTNKKNGRWGQYLSLVSIAGLFIAFTLVRAPEVPVVQKSGEQFALVSPVADTIPDKEIESVHVRKNNGKTKITIHYKDGASETMSEAEAIRMGIDIPPPPPPPPPPMARGKHMDGKTMPPPPPVPTAPVSGKDHKNIPPPLPPAPRAPASMPGNRNIPPPPPPSAPPAPRQDNSLNLLRSNVMLILDGKEITREDMAALDPNTLESITILKGRKAAKKYGLKASNGVIVMNSKEKL